jgi:putative ABC transport system ATP-binding protein
MTTAPVVELHDVSKMFQTDGLLTKAVQNISLSFYPGELILLLGPSGSGKTTLLNLIAGLIEPTAGSVIIFEKMIGQYSGSERQKLRAENIGFIFQTFMLVDALTVSENIELVLRFTGSGQREARARVLEILNRLNIGYLSARFPGSLSQGEKQRVAIARAVANDGILILADEPTASLESRQGFQIIELLHSFAKEKNKCVVVASHDTRIVPFADRVLGLCDGEVNKSSEPRFTGLKD